MRNVDWEEKILNSVETAFAYSNTDSFGSQKTCCGVQRRKESGIRGGPGAEN